MDIYVIRRANINLLADKFGRKEISEKLGYPDNNYVNQLCGGHGSFGARTARKIEAALDYPQGWMDSPQRSAEVNGGVCAPAATYAADASLPPEVQDLIATIRARAREGALTDEHIAVLKGTLELMTRQK